MAAMLAIRLSDVNEAWTIAQSLDIKVIPMSVLALAFFSDLRATVSARFLSKGRSLLVAVSIAPLPEIPREKPQLLRDAGFVMNDSGLGCPRPYDHWRQTAVRDAVYRSHWML